MSSLRSCRTYTLPQIQSSDRIDGAALQQLEDDIRRDLADDAGGEHPGTTIALGLYANLPLPSAEDDRWDSPVKRNFDVGAPSDPAIGYMLERTLSLDDWVRCQLQLWLIAQIGFSATSSMHVGWTQRHPDLVGTASDPSMRRRRALEARGYGLDETITFSHAFATVVLRRR